MNEFGCRPASLKEIRRWILFLLLFNSIGSRATELKSPSDFRPSGFNLEFANDFKVEESPSEPPYYLALTLQKEALDVSKPTRVIVAGEGHTGGEGAVFQEAAVSLALRYREAYPSEQVLLFFAIQGSLSQELAIIQDWKLRILAQGQNRLGFQELMDQLVNLKQIQALHVFSHASTDFALIQGWDGISSNSDFTVLQERLAADAFVMIHGCNAGWSLAPALAQILKVPVAGALTSTNFERLHSVGNFFFNDNETKPQGAWAVKNTLSFLKPVPCYQGACMRMKPDNHPYQGVHGNYPQGLPFYKFFCPEGAQQSCEKTMAQALIGFVDLKPLAENSNEEAFKAAARDWLCPISNSTSVRAQCLQALQAAEKNPNSETELYSPYLGKIVSCDSSNCWESSDEEKPDTFVKEYRAFLRGIHILTSVNLL